jgi:hypothetical protein
MEKRLDTVEDKSPRNADDNVSVQKKMEKIEDNLKKQSSQNVDAVYEEFVQREAKRMNVIVHGVLECDEKENNREKRIEWDLTRIEDIFSAGAESDEGGREDLQESGGEWEYARRVLPLKIHQVFCGDGVRGRLHHSRSDQEAEKGGGKHERGGR